MEHRWPGFGPADILLPQNCDLTKWERSGLRPVYLSERLLAAGSGAGWEMPPPR